MVKLTERREITPYRWTHPDDDDRRKWLDLNTVYSMPVGPRATCYIAAGEVRIFEKFEDLPPVIEPMTDDSETIALRATVT
jgi:hypothetical protein